MEHTKKQFIDEIARESIQFGKFEKGKIIKRIILIRKAQEFRTFPDQLEAEIMERINELKSSETKEDTSRIIARMTLRKLKENGTPITKDSARWLFDEAGWNYDENSTYLEIPEDDN